MEKQESVLRLQELRARDRIWCAALCNTVTDTVLLEQILREFNRLRGD